jgi:ComF family protein
MLIAQVFRKIMRRSASLLMETVAPKDPQIREMEESGLERFKAKAARSLSSDLGKDIICLYSYKDPPAKKAILEVKSYGNKAVADMLGKAVYEALIEEIFERACFENFTRPLLVPIPMTKKSIRERGWNQCLLFAQAFKRYDVSNAFELSPGALVKIRTTEDQVGKGRRERFRNLEGSFSAEEIVRGRNVIVLDDICTTGATFTEARRALRGAGARKILCIALAH